VEDNHNNICVVNGSSLVKNLDGGLQEKFDSLAGMFPLEDVTPISIVCRVYNN